VDGYQGFFGQNNNLFWWEISRLFLRSFPYQLQLFVYYWMCDVYINIINVLEPDWFILFWLGKTTPFPCLSPKGKGDHYVVTSTYLYNSVLIFLWTSLWLHGCQKTIVKTTAPARCFDHLTASSNQYFTKKIYFFIFNTNRNNSHLFRNLSFVIVLCAPLFPGSFYSRWQEGVICNPVITNTLYNKPITKNTLQH
jgi:hypothetical protein